MPFLGYLLARPVMESDQFFRPQRCQGVRSPFVVAELDLSNAGGEKFNDGSYLAANESLFGQIMQHRNFGK